MPKTPGGVSVHLTETLGGVSVHLKEPAWWSETSTCNNSPNIDISVLRHSDKPSICQQAVVTAEGELPTQITVLDAEGERST